MPAAYTVVIMGIHVRREYTSALRAEHAFAGLSWADARHVTAAISYDVRVGR